MIQYFVSNQYCIAKPGILFQSMKICKALTDGNLLQSTNISHFKLLTCIGHSTITYTFQVAWLKICLMNILLHQNKTFGHNCLDAGDEAHLVGHSAYFGNSILWNIHIKIKSEIEARRNRYYKHFLSPHTHRKICLLTHINRERERETDI